MSIIPIRDYLVYLLVRSLVCVMQILSMRQCRRIASWAASLAFHFDHRHRNVALENLERAFPNQYSPKQLQQFVWNVYYHFAVMITEIAHIPRKLHGSNYRDFIKLTGIGPVIRSSFRGDPVIMLTGHFGNWEMAGYMLGVWGFQSQSVARPLDNPYLDRFLRSFREKTGQSLIPKKGGMAMIEDALENSGDIVCLVADQDAGRHGIFVDFFGTPASTHKAIALLALQHNATIMIGGARRLGQRFQYEVCVSDVIPSESVAGAKDEIHALTQQFTHSLEQMIRTAPEQYLWLHRRWKTRPGARRSRKNRTDRNNRTSDTHWNKTNSPASSSL